MRKNIKKLMFSTASAALALNLVLPAAAVSAKQTTGAQLYTVAYDAVVKSLKDRTQQSINTARKAINNLRGTDGQWAIGEFSKQVDTVQQELFVKFMNLVYYENSPLERDEMTIEEINEATALIRDFSTYEGNKPYITSWSSAVDRYVQMHINNIEEKYKLFKSNGDRDLKEELNALISEMENIKENQGVQTWLKDIKENLDKVEVKKYATLSIPLTLENFSCTMEWPSDLVNNNPENINVAFDEEHNSIVIKVYNPEGGTFTLPYSTTKIYTDKEGKIQYEVTKEPRHYDFYESALNIEDAKVEGVIDEMGNESKGVIVDTKIKDGVISLSMVPTQEGTYRLVFTGKDNHKTYALMKTYKEGYVDVYVQPYTPPIEKQQELSLDNTIANFGTVLCSESTMKLTRNDIVKVDLDEKNNKVNIKSLAQGSATLVVTTGNQEAYIYFTVSQSGEIEIATHKQPIRVWDLGYDIEVNEIGPIIDETGAQSQGITLEKIDGCIQVYLNKVGTYTTRVTAYNEGPTYLTISVDHTGYISWYWYPDIIKNTTKAQGITSITNSKGEPYTGLSAAFTENKENIVVVPANMNKKVPEGTYSVNLSNGKTISIMVNGNGDISIK